MNEKLTAAEIKERMAKGIQGMQAFADSLYRFCAENPELAARIYRDSLKPCDEG